MAARYDLSVADLEGLLPDEPAFRARQLFDGLYRRLQEPGDLTELPLALRERLESLAELQPALKAVAEHVGDGGATVKWLFLLPGGASIETVLMRYRDRSTVCVSSQAGCAMACSFCATGQGGFGRQLSAGEIVEQVVHATRTASQRGWPRVSNVVFMGMGEPLANYGGLLKAIRRLTEDLGMSARGLTVSTVGVVPGIRRLASEGLAVNLALSLHAANDELRTSLIPLNRRWPLAELAKASAEWVEASGRRLSLEWAAMDGVNDSAKDVEELAAFALPLRSHVNIIPLNSTPGWPVKPTPLARIDDMVAHLRSLGVNATVRDNRGTDIAAACGQLAAQASTKSPTRRVATPTTTKLRP